MFPTKPPRNRGGIDVTTVLVAVLIIVCIVFIINRI